MEEHKQKFRSIRFCTDCERREAVTLTAQDGKRFCASCLAFCASCLAYWQAIEARSDTGDLPDVRAFLPTAKDKE